MENELTKCLFSLIKQCVPQARLVYDNYISVAMMDYEKISNFISKNFASHIATDVDDVGFRDDMILIRSYNSYLYLKTSQTLLDEVKLITILG